MWQTPVERTLSNNPRLSAKFHRPRPSNRRRSRAGRRITPRAASRSSRTSTPSARTISTASESTAWCATSARRVGRPPPSVRRGVDDAQHLRWFGQMTNQTIGRTADGQDDDRRSRRECLVQRLKKRSSWHSPQCRVRFCSTRDNTAAAGIRAVGRPRPGRRSPRRGRNHWTRPRVCTYWGYRGGLDR